MSMSCFVLPVQAVLASLDLLLITMSLQESVTIVLPVNLIAALQTEHTTRHLSSFPSFF